MTQVTLPRPDLVDTPWQGCPGLRASAIDGAASIIVMEVLVDAFSRMPHGSAALDEACARHAAATPESLLGNPLELAARALALALIDAARGLDERGRAAA